MQPPSAACHVRYPGVNTPVCPCPACRPPPRYPRLQAAPACIAASAWLMQARKEGGTEQLFGVCGWQLHLHKLG